MKKAIIIHGWESSPEEHWYQEEKALLEGRGYEVCVPLMPGGSYPIEDEWVRVTAGYNPDKETVLIGHSLGAPTILRYLEKAESPVGKVFLVAGFASPLQLDYPNEEYPRKFVERPFDWGKIRNNAEEFWVINQDHDQWVPFAKGREISGNVAGNLTQVEGTDHFDKMNLNLINERLR